MDTHNPVSTRALRHTCSPNREAYTRASYQTAERLRKQIGLDPQGMAAFLGVSEKTYQRRADEGRLKEAESLKLEMLERVMQTALDVFPDEVTARRWLHSPVVSLGNIAPLNALTGIRGYERVRNTLYQQAYGMF